MVIDGIEVSKQFFNSVCRTLDFYACETGYEKYKNLLGCLVNKVSKDSVLIESKIIEEYYPGHLLYNENFLRRYIKEKISDKNEYFSDQVFYNTVSKIFFLFDKLGTLRPNLMQVVENCLDYNFNKSINSYALVDILRISNMGDLSIYDWNTKSLALFILNASKDYEKNNFSCKNEFFTPITIFELIKKIVNEGIESSRYEQFEDKNLIINACLRILNFEYSSLSDIEKKYSLEILDFLNNVGFNKQSVVSVHPFIKTKENETMLSILPEKEAMKLVKNTFFNINSIYADNTDFIFSLFINRISKGLDIDSSFLADIREVFIKPFFVKIFSKYNSNDVPFFEFYDNVLYIKACRIYDGISYDREIFKFEISNHQLEAFSDLRFFKDKAIKDLFLSSLSVFNKRDILYFIICDNTDCSYEEIQGNLGKYYFFSNDKNLIPSNKYFFNGNHSKELLIDDYKYFFDEKNLIYSANFTFLNDNFKLSWLKLLKKNIKKPSFFDRLFNNEENEIIVEGLEKTSKYYNIVATCMSGKIVNNYSNTVKKVDESTKIVTNVLDKYIKDLSDVHSRISSDSIKENDVFIQNLENLLSSLKEISKLSDTYFSKNPDSIMKVSNILDKYWPIIEVSIEKYSVCTSLDSSELYSKEMEKGLAQLALDINNLLKTLLNELKAAIDADKLFDVIEMSSELKSINSLLSKSSLEMDMSTN